MRLPIRLAAYYTWKLLKFIITNGVGWLKEKHGSLQTVFGQKNTNTRPSVAWVFYQRNTPYYHHNWKRHNTKSLVLLYLTTQATPLQSCRFLITGLLLILAETLADKKSRETEERRRSCCCFWAAAKPSLCGTSLPRCVLLNHLKTLLPCIIIMESYEGDQPEETWCWKGKQAPMHEGKWAVIFVAVSLLGWASPNHWDHPISLLTVISTRVDMYHVGLPSSVNT